MKRFDERNPGQAFDQSEDLKTILFGHLLFTNKYGFKADRPVFSVSADFKYFCQKREGIIDGDYANTYSVQSGDDLIACCPSSTGVSVTEISNLLGRGEVEKT